jgi:phosphonate transport system permease protein
MSETPFPARAEAFPDALRAFERARQELLSRRRGQTILFGAIFVAAVIGSAVVGEFNLAKLAAGAPRITEYVEKTIPVLRLGSLGHDIAEWYYGIGKWLRLLGETILMAYLATLLGTLGAFVTCFAASRNLAPSSAIYFVTRRFLEFCRTVPDLVYALIFIFAFGLGPLAGILAIAIHSWGGSGKLFAEANENIDMRAVEGLRASGANWFQTMRYAVVPQVLPNFTSFTLWRFELNVRSSAIIGFVGAGGIGDELYTVIRVLYYEDVSAIILLLVGTISVIDTICERLRHKLTGQEHLA